MRRQLVFRFLAFRIEVHGWPRSLTVSVRVEAESKGGELSQSLALPPPSRARSVQGLAGLRLPASPPIRDSHP